MLAKFVNGFCKAANAQIKIQSKFTTQFQQSRWKHVIRHEDALEVQVPLPYGNMAGNYCKQVLQIQDLTKFTPYLTGKEWGDLDGYPILCLHGLADNCDSFAPVGPLLSDRFRYIALDAFGHGKTSHAPIGTTNSYWDLVIYLKRAIDHFKINKFSILGHSMGGSTGLLFASLYPHLVDRLLTLDIVKPVTVPLLWHSQDLAEAIDLQLDYERKFTNPKFQKSFTLEELVNRYVESLGGTIKPEAVRILLKRGSKVSGNGFAFSFDPRMVNIYFSVKKFINGFNSHDSNSIDASCHHAFRHRGTKKNYQRTSKMPSKNSQSKTRTSIWTGRMVRRI